MKNFDPNSAQYSAARRHVKEIKGFYMHLGAYLMVNLLLICTTAYQNGQFNFSQVENYYTAFFWGIGLLAHGLSVFTTTRIFSKKWEQRKIAAYMEEYKTLNK